MVHRYLVEENGLNSSNPDWEFYCHGLAADCRYSILENYVNGKIGKIGQDTTRQCEHCKRCPLVGYEAWKEQALTSAAIDA